MHGLALLLKFFVVENHQIQRRLQRGYAKADDAVLSQKWITRDDQLEIFLSGNLLSPSSLSSLRVQNTDHDILMPVITSWRHRYAQLFRSPLKLVHNASSYPSIASETQMATWRMSVPLFGNEAAPSLCSHLSNFLRRSLSCSRVRQH